MGSRVSPATFARLCYLGWQAMREPPDRLEVLHVVLPPLAPRLVYLPGEPRPHIRVERGSR